MTIESEQNPTPKPAPPLHWPSVAQFVLSLLAALVAWGLAAMLGLTGIMQMNAAPEMAAFAETQMLFASGSLLVGAILLASAGLALLRILGRPVQVPVPFSRLGLTWARYLPPVLTPLVIGAGYLVVTYMRDWAWLLLPPIHILAVGLPVLWLVTIAVKNLPMGSSQRVSGLLGSGLTLGPAFSLVLEMAVLVLLVIGAGIIVAGQENIARELITIGSRLETARTERDMLTFRYAQKKEVAVIFTALAYIAGLVPLIEELVKPVGVWLLAGRRQTPAAGFTAGVLSGAAFALFENFALTQSIDEWPLITITRIGTAIVHITTTGMMGWALASAWQQRKYVRLSLVYLGAVLFHGLWNATAILDGVAPLFQDLHPDHWLAFLSPWLPYILGAYTLLAFTTLIMMRNKLAAPGQPSETPEETLAVEPAEAIKTLSPE